MIRRKHGTSLSPRTVQQAEDVNPMSYITNVADCMLVLVVGLLVALVGYYGIDLGSSQDDEIQPVIGTQVNLDSDLDGVIDDQYEPTGVVFYDKEADTYYFVEE